MERILNQVIPGLPIAGHAPENVAPSNISVGETGSPITKQKLPSAAFSKKTFVKKETVVEEYCTDHPYEILKKIKVTHSYSGNIRNYKGYLKR